MYLYCHLTACPGWHPLPGPLTFQGLSEPLCLGNSEHGSSQGLAPTYNIGVTWKAQWSPLGLKSLSHPVGLSHPLGFPNKWPKGWAQLSSCEMWFTHPLQLVKPSSHACSADHNWHQEGSFRSGWCL